jgi:hypothetical protein
MVDGMTRVFGILVLTPGRCGCARENLWWRDRLAQPARNSTDSFFDRFCSCISPSLDSLELQLPFIHNYEPFQNILYVERNFAVYIDS